MAKSGPGAACWVGRGPARRAEARPPLTDPGAPLYIDTSASLRAVLEHGTSPEIEASIAAAPVLVTSRLALVESVRALLRLRQRGGVSESRLADARRELDAVWSRCELWELTPAVCQLASLVAPDNAVRTLDALHLATFLSLAGGSKVSSCSPRTTACGRQRDTSDPRRESIAGQEPPRPSPSRHRALPGA